MYLDIMLTKVFFVLEDSRAYAARDMLSRRVHVCDVLSKVSSVGKFATAH